MSNTTALVPYLFEGHRIRVSTDQQGEAWIVVADACAALSESPMVWAMANLREEEHCLHSEEGPGAGGFTLALINEAALLRRLLNSDNPSAGRMRRWLTHELLPALQRRHHSTGELPRPSIDAIRRQTAAEVLRGADEIIQLTGVSHAEALLSVLEQIQAHSSPTGAEGQHCLSQRAGVAWLTGDALGISRETLRRLRLRGVFQPGKHFRRWGCTQSRGPLQWHLENVEAAITGWSKRNLRV